MSFLPGDKTSTQYGQSSSPRWLSLSTDMFIRVNSVQWYCINTMFPMISKCTTEASQDYDEDHKYTSFFDRAYKCLLDEFPTSKAERFRAVHNLKLVTAEIAEAKKIGMVFLFLHTLATYFSYPSVAGNFFTSHSITYEVRWEVEERSGNTM